MTLDEAMKMLGRQMTSEGCSPATLTAYSTDVAAFGAYLRSNGAKNSVAQFTRENVKGWLQAQTAQGIAASSRNRHLSALSRLAEFLLGLDKLTVDPTRGIRMAKKPQRVVKVLTDEDASRLIHAAGPTGLSRFGKDNANHTTVIYEHRDEAILRVFLQGGLRIGEVASLTIGSLKTDGLLVRGKGNKERMVVMPKPVMVALTKWLGERKGKKHPEEALFLSATGRPLSKKQVWRVVKAAGNAIGVQVHPHMLRHTHATVLLSRGANKEQIQTRLGHASVTTTEMYIHAVPQGQDKVAALVGDL